MPHLVGISHNGKLTLSRGLCAPYALCMGTPLSRTFTTAYLWCS